MGLIQRQDDQQTEVQKRVAAELQARLRMQTPPTDLNDIEPDMLKNQHQTRLAGMIIAILIAVLVIVLIVVAVTIS